MGSHTITTKEYKEFVNKLAGARRAAGFKTQEAAAKAIGGHRDQRYISRCESGQRRIDVVELYEFARAYGVEPSELLEPLESLMTKRLRKRMSKRSKAELVKATPKKTKRKRLSKAAKKRLKKGG